VAAPPSIKNTDSQSIDTIYGADGTGRIKKAIGDVTAGGGLTPHLGWEGVATHQDADAFATNDGLVVAAGVELSGTAIHKLAVDANGKLYVVASLATPALVGTGHKDVAVTGTAVALRSSTACTSVTVKADTANAATIYVGISTVTNDETAGTGGLQLEPGESIAIDVANLATVFINGTAGDGVSYMWEI